MTVVSQPLKALLPRVYAIVDPARDLETLLWLRTSGLAHQSLFEGQRAVDLAEESPYVVHLADSAGRLEDFLSRFFGKSCITLLTSDSSFYAVRRHLRRFLVVKDVDGRPLFFRYYDPRIAAAFFPSCDPAQSERVFADVVSAYWVENADGDAWLELRPSGEGDRPVETTRHELGRSVEERRAVP